ncbi:MAG TPA: YceI family protein [Anaeromyxobacter sp.]
MLKRGLLSAMAHHHHFVASKWHATAIFDGASPSGARVEVIIAADSLRDQQAALSQEDRGKVDRQAAGPGVLDARRYPEIRFVSNPLDLEPVTSIQTDAGLRGVLTGTLSRRRETGGGPAAPSRSSRAASESALTAASSVRSPYTTR